MTTPNAALASIIDSSLARELPPAVAHLAESIRFKHGADVAAVLVYGSCLRDTPATDSLIDYFVLVDRAEAISDNRLSRYLCQVIPPNVYYAEETVDGTLYRAKYAVLTLDTFARKVSRNTRNPYFWARFAQPAGLAYCRDQASRERVASALADAAATMLANICPLAKPDDDAIDLWTRGLAATYASELRSEGSDRARQIVESDMSYYQSITDAVLGPSWPSVDAGSKPDWRRVQRSGKALSVLRLIKAAFTFRGGADYLAWKISRHSGQQIELTDWQRRHPILASIVLLPRLLRSGAVR